MVNEILPKMEPPCISEAIHLLMDLPDTKRTKGCDRSPVLVPPISRILQHQINKLGPLRLPKYPVVVAVVPTLNLINVGCQEAVQGVPGYNINASFMMREPYRTTIKIRLESTMPFNWLWFSRGKWVRILLCLVSRSCHRSSGSLSYVYPPTMLAIDASASLARSKKFSIHVEEPAFGTLYMAVKIIG